MAVYFNTLRSPLVLQLSQKSTVVGPKTTVILEGEDESTSSVVRALGQRKLRKLPLQEQEPEQEVKLITEELPTPVNTFPDPKKGDEAEDILPQVANGVENLEEKEENIAKSETPKVKSDKQLLKGK